MKAYDSTELKRLHREWRRRTTGRIAIVLDNVQTPVNVGSIARLAAAYRVEHVWTAGATPPLDHAGARKSGMGSERFVEWSSAPTGVEAVEAARAGGFTCIGLELADAAIPITAVDFAHPTCLVVGHEDRGVPAVTLDACDLVAFIPQVGRIGSLNVAAATAIALFEARRAEWIDP